MNGLTRNGITVRLTRVILTALTVAACAPSVRPSGYAPKWHVGDWWVVMTWQRYSPFCDWGSQYTRYDVTCIEKVGQQDCFVVETRSQGADDWLAGNKNVLYVRTDNWFVVRRVWVRTNKDTLCPPDTLECPLGLLGPSGGGEPRLPRFPLVPGDPDTAFRLQRRGGYSAKLREISRAADPAMVERWLDEGDSACGRVVRPTGVVYLVRNEVGGDIEPRHAPHDRRVAQSLQLWSSDLPWRPYEELALNYGSDYGWLAAERSWLIAVGHSGE